MDRAIENHHRRLQNDYEKIWQNFLKKEAYQNDVLRRKTDRWKYYESIQNYLRGYEKAKILELGCGTGIDLSIIAAENGQSICFGSDLSVASIRISREINKKFGKGIQFFVADTLNLPLKRDAFDLIYSQGLIEHFKDPARIIRSQLSALKSGGILIVNVPQRFTGYTWMKKKLMKVDRWHLGWETEFSYRDLRKIGRQLGLIEKDVFGYQYWKSWKEPLFVLRDLYDKFHRRNPLRRYRSFTVLKRLYDGLWEKLENRWGHYFLQNIVIVFQKESNENPSC
jgi:SAM-dependent methyltransferase